MQNMVLVVAVVTAFVFGCFVVRALGDFLDENQTSQEPETNTVHLTDEVEKQTGK